MTTTATAAPAPNPFLSALKAAAPLFSSYLVAEIETNRTAIDARVTQLGTTAVGRVKDTLLAALPHNGLLATVFAPEAEAVIAKLASEIVAQLGGEVDALVHLAELEIESFAKQIAS